MTPKTRFFISEILQIFKVGERELKPGVRDERKESV
jgi:hypothetical protein